MDPFGNLVSGSIGKARRQPVRRAIWWAAVICEDAELRWARAAVQEKLIRSDGRVSGDARRWKEAIGTSSSLTSPTGTSLGAAHCENGGDSVSAV